MSPKENYLPFFSDTPNKTVLRDFLNRHSSDNRFAQESKKQRLEECLVVIRSIFNEAEEWDKVCRFNIKHVGSRFIERLVSPSINEQTLDEIFIYCIRFLFEFEFWIDHERLNGDLDRVVNHVFGQVDYYEGNVKEQVKFAINLMPSRIIREMVHDPKVEVYREFSREKGEAEEFRDSWKKEVIALKKKCNGLREELEKHKTAFNFVGLYSGFSELYESKVIEARNLWLWIRWIGAIILIPIAFELGYLLYETYKGETIGVSHIFIFIPIASIVLILIYYLRVFLKDHNSVKAQIVQIQLRMTLCQFIQDYAKYSSDIKENDGVALEKFESIIFSGIAGDFEKVPSTFDGLDQIAKLISVVKGRE